MDYNLSKGEVSEGSSNVICLPSNVFEEHVHVIRCVVCGRGLLLEAKVLPGGRDERREGVGGQPLQGGQ